MSLSLGFYSRGTRPGMSFAILKQKKKKTGVDFFFNRIKGWSYGKDRSRKNFQSNTREKSGARLYS